MAGHGALHLFNASGVPDGNVLSNFRTLLSMCNQDQQADEHKAEMWRRIQDENERFFAALGGEAGDLLTEDEVARDVHEAMTKLHASGEGYAALDAAEGAARLSTELWATFSRQAAASFLTHAPSYFLQPLVSPWVHQSMFSAWPYTFGTQLALMVLSDDWSPVWSRLLQESPVGNPPMCDLAGHSLLDVPDAPTTSSNLVHQVFHHFIFHAVTGTYAWENTDLILEFGGGYGALCLATLAGGFRGQYLIYDLPVFLQVQTCASYSRAIASTLTRDSYCMRHIHMSSSRGVRDTTAPAVCAVPLRRRYETTLF